MMNSSNTFGAKKRQTTIECLSANDITSPDRFGKVQYQGTGVVKYL